MIQNRSKNNKKWFLERTNISPKSIGQQPKLIQNLVRKSFKNRFLEPCWLKMTPPWSHLGPRWARGSIFHRFWCILYSQYGWKIHGKSILGLILGQDGCKEVSSWANMNPRTDFECFLNNFLNHFRLMSDRFWTDICSLQELILTYS